MIRILDSFEQLESTPQTLVPLVGSRVPAGFKSPSDPYLEDLLDLNEKFISNPASTFFMRVEGDSMIGAGIFSGDYLIVDRSKTAKSNDIVIAEVDGELTLKRLIYQGHRCFLVAENENFKPIEVSDASESLVWGVVTFNIHKPK